MMVPLNLPAYNPTIKNQNGVFYVFDPVRRKYIQLSPEEWVRQHLINYLAQHLGYPIGLMQVEKGLKYNNLIRRSDLLIYNASNQSPLLLAECKAPEVALTEAVVQQIASYNYTVKAPILLITNGLQLICCSLQQGKLSMLKQVPAYSELVKLY